MDREELKKELLVFAKKEHTTKAEGLIWEDVVNVEIVRAYKVDDYDAFTVSVLIADCNVRGFKEVIRNKRSFFDYVYKDKKFQRIETYQYNKKAGKRGKNN